jgi:ubiquinone/menaquinone biosynthesis C-methylase UbiE
MTTVLERPQYGHRIWTPKDGYNLVAPVYDEWYWRPFWMRNEVPHLERLAGQVSALRRSLDLGCGTGTYCSVLERYGKVFGVDPALEMLKVARRRALSATNLICGRASTIPLGDETVDMTVAARSLCHEQDLAGAFRELARVTSSGGMCVISEVHAQHDYPRTRIPFGAHDVHIETFKRSPEEIIDIATAGAVWQVDHKSEVRWKDLDWKPDDHRFFRIDRTSERAIFFVIKLRRQ